MDDCSGRSSAFYPVEKSINGYIAACTLAEIAPFVEMALKYDTTGGFLSVDDFENRKYFKVVDAAGAVIGGYVLSITRLKKGCYVWIEIAAGNNRKIDFQMSVLPTIEAYAKSIGAFQIAFVTERKGLMRRMEKDGYREAGRVYSKRIGVE
ncbi:MAG: hypothetical protein ACXWJD_04030 [Burkholderiaceae bacterium]